MTEFHLKWDFTVEMFEMNHVANEFRLETENFRPFAVGWEAISVFKVSLSHDYISTF